MAVIDYKMIFTLLGGLALFIYGMQQMGEGLQKSAGDKMRIILQKLTGNIFFGILVGALVTIIIQSSSATTVMVIGFVSAGLMTLPQAFSVIMGANIGTTMTAWIVAIKIDDFAWVFVAIGFIMLFVCKKPKIRYIGQIIFAFGVLFVGLKAMGEAVRPLSKSPEFADLLLQIKDVPILGLLVGSLSTIIVQSSSASIGVLQTLASTPKDDIGTPLISLYQAIPILFGSNIGTTVTAFLASLGSKRKEAKRAALAHAIFNVTGSLMFMAILTPYVGLIDHMIRLTGFDLLEDVNNLMTPTAEYMRQGIALSHTIFNISTMMIWAPFVWLMVILVKKIIPGTDPVNERTLVYISYTVINSPSLAIDLATKEIARMTDMASTMTQKVQRILMGDYQSVDIDEMVEKENGLDYLENEIVRYLSTIISRNTLTEQDSSKVAGLMHATNDIERIGDHCMNITNIAMDIKEQNLQFSDMARTELEEAFSIIKQMVNDSITALRDQNLVLAGKIISQENVMDELEKKIRQRHLQRIDSGLCDPQATIIFLEIIHTMERISDHCKNLAEVAISYTDYQIHRS
jgi:phosphate:Na+ symporter